MYHHGGGFGGGLLTRVLGARRGEMSGRTARQRGDVGPGHSSFRADAAASPKYNPTPIPRTKARIIGHKAAASSTGDMGRRRFQAKPSCAGPKLPNKAQLHRPGPLLFQWGIHAPASPLRRSLGQDEIPRKNHGVVAHVSATIDWDVIEFQSYLGNQIYALWRADRLISRRGVYDVGAKAVGGGSVYCQHCGEDYLHALAEPIGRGRRNGGLMAGYLIVAGCYLRSILRFPLMRLPGDDKLGGGDNGRSDRCEDVANGLQGRHACPLDCSIFSSLCW
jgi:hypothetical protein